MFGPPVIVFLLFPLAPKKWALKNITQAATALFSKKNPYLSCNIFADETFRGRVWNDARVSGPGEDCVYFQIEKSPRNLLQGQNLFLQIHPFSVEREGDFRYGALLPINTVKKADTGGENEVLIQSQIIDSYLVNVRLETNPDGFFFDHIFEICDVDDKWKGLQLTVYSRKENISKPSPIRTTKFLLPPFPAHPERFKSEYGDGLAAFHPFLEARPENRDQRNHYYNLAEHICGA